MIWTASTPIYLPLTDPLSIRLAAERLADAVAAALGERPPLRGQPAPFGQSAVLLAPDPAYTAAVAPEPAETFAILTSGPELVVTGADSLGTVYGIEWLIRHVVPYLAGSPEVVLDLELPAWKVARRALRVSTEPPAQLLALGYNTIAAPPGVDTQPYRAAGLRVDDGPADAVPRDWFA